MRGWIRVTLALLLASCANAPPRAPEPVPGPAWSARSRAEAAALAAHLAALPTAAAGTFVVRLAFDARSDLDLYVSDPLQETVYYANTPSRSGGRLGADRHCKDGGGPGPRVEEIVFSEPPAGTYRVGVDYPHRCRSGAGIGAWAITLDANGERRELRGLSEPVVFIPIVTEVEVGP